MEKRGVITEVKADHDSEVAMKDLNATWDGRGRSVSDWRALRSCK